MSKDLLIERLRMRRIDGTPAAHDMQDAADRIERLEAALYDVVHCSLDAGVVKRAEIALGLTAKETEL